MTKHNYVFQNEAMLLGAIIQDNTIIDELTLQPNQFSTDQNRFLYKKMSELHGLNKDISFLNLTNLPQKEIQRMGGLDHLSDVMNSTPSTHAFRNYEQVIKEHHAVELARNQAKEFIEITKEINDIEMLNEYLRKVTDLEVGTVSDQETFKRKVLKRVQEHYESPEKGLSGIDTGFRTTNSWTDGWQNGELIIIAGRPSMGKTAFALNSLLRGCINDSGIFATFFSIEMSEGMVIDRLIANVARVNVNKMRNPNKAFNKDDWSKHSNALGILESLNIDLRNERTVPDIRAVVRKNMNQYPDKNHVIAIDYLTLMKSLSQSGNRTYDIEEIIVGLKDIAKQLDIPVIVLSQLSRGVESRDDKRPNMGDLRDSGAIEQAADLVVMLYRDEYYKEDTDKPGVTELIFVKNRNGPVGKLEMVFDKGTNNFSDMP